MQNVWNESLLLFTLNNFDTPIGKLTDNVYIQLVRSTEQINPYFILQIRKSETGGLTSKVLGTLDNVLDSKVSSISTIQRYSANFYVILYKSKTPTTLTI